ncbi:VIR protein [Plasmodium vivax]|uniref:VIR protein n=1 Tax=Plasmodium vivax TaxID=5855 RepID=A0A1G4E435_PLAVI|nr:VIR protein [Plasmodium vivax]
MEKQVCWFYGLLENFWDESDCCNKEKVYGKDKGKDKYICKNKFIKTFNLDVLKYKRDSYDFFEYYDYIKNILSRRYQQNNEEYCDYINYIFKLYHKLEEEVGQRGLPHIYERELNLFRNKFGNDNELSSIKSKCNINNSIIESIKSMYSANLSAGSHEKIVTRHTVSPDYGLYDPKTSTDIKTVLSELSSKIYKNFNEEVSAGAYNSTHCGSLKGDIKNICKKLARNLEKLSTNNEAKNENNKDRCTRLNFWLYDAISKKRNNIDQNLSNITEFANILHANIKINNDLIKKDFIQNSESLFPKKTITQKQDTPNDPNIEGEGNTQKSTDTGQAQTPEENAGKEGPTVDARTKLHTSAMETPGSKRDKGTTVPGENPGNGGNTGTGANAVNKNIPPPYKFVNYKELSKYNPCVFNYDCTLSECREMKHLYEYFKAYDTIKGNIKCGNGKNDKYFKYIKYISFLYNKHKEDCCSWGAEICPDYFLECEEYYNPNEIVTTIESGDIETCNKILEVPVPEKSKDVPSVDLNSGENMYIKYFTCSYVTDSKFEKKGLRCQQPGYSAHLNDRLSARRNIIKRQNNTSGLDGKKIIINGKTINAVLISDPYAKITGEDGAENSMPDDQYTLFPEIRGAARKAYVKQAKEACKNGEIKEGMEEYCRKSKRYNKIINLSNSQSANVTLKEDIENWEDIVIPDDTSFLNEILQQLPVRMGAVSLASLGAITMLFMYYKFTPFGSWLRNKIGGEKKMKHGNHGEPRKSLNYEQDHMPQISQKKRIKIAYQSS